MHQHDFEDYAEYASDLIGELLTRFTVNVGTIPHDDFNALSFAASMIQHLQTAMRESIKVLDALEHGLSTFDEPIPPGSDTDFEADVLRDLASLDNPRLRPVSRDEVLAWRRSFIEQQAWGE